MGTNAIIAINNTQRMKMTKKRNILIRDVPEAIYTWIENERYSKRISQKEFLLKVLETAASYNSDGSQPSLFDFRPQIARPVPGDLPFSFIDLFAGIGGMRLGLQWVGGRCLFTCEWDRYAQKTYAAWFNETPHGDIREIPPASIPDHDILAAGFPCQPFSIAGVSKKNSLGRLHGFKDANQGNLFFYLATIVSVKRPLALILENVKNLASHDSGRTWSTIKGTLEDMDYLVFHKIIDARAYVPQHRERIFIVCFDRRVFGDYVPFEFPDQPAGKSPCLGNILENETDPKYTLSNHLWKYLKDYAERHREKGNGFGYGLADRNSITRTLSARYYKDGSEILVPQNGKSPRRLTPRECARLMGFPDELPIVVSDTQAYRQFGNALVPQIASDVARQVVRVFRWSMEAKGLTHFKTTVPTPAKERRREYSHASASGRTGRH
jgi:DNA (cytosine-5)-methyltransferase 1